MTEAGGRPDAPRGRLRRGFVVAVVVAVAAAAVLAGVAGELQMAGGAGFLAVAFPYAWWRSAAPGGRRH